MSETKAINKTVPAAPEKSGTKKFGIYAICVTAIMSAIAVIFQFFEFPVPFLVPGFVKMDFSDLPALLTSFLISPLAGVAVCLIKNIIHIVTSSSAGVGELANFLMGAVMVLTAGYIYRIRKNRITALIGCIAGSLLMGIVSIFINYYITYPFYVTAMSFPLEAIIGTYNEINPDLSVDLWSCLIWFNMPFTILKGLAVSVITFVIYKPLSKALKHFH